MRKKKNENNRSIIVIEVTCSINRDYDFNQNRPALLSFILSIYSIL